MIKKLTRYDLALGRRPEPEEKDYNKIANWPLSPEHLSALTVPWDRSQTPEWLAWDCFEQRARSNMAPRLHPNDTVL